ncbi:tryptophan synthase subunit alpha [Synergistaceae bacterium OttesenSCG-928-I11]|nr:tryptophan synthase subunit alpha [Synergistaceae bacterium OttesenSCG-928-I11]
MTARYKRMFDALKQEGRGAFIPFVMLGDPDMAESLAILKTLAASGADALELGIPFSDPIADGPTIQTAANRALASGATPTKCLDLVAAFRKEYPDLPIGLLVYANLVIGRGIDAFYEHAAKCGVDSVLVADAPTAESGDFLAGARKHGVAPVYIVPPNADEAAMKKISEICEGYTYLLGRAGVTGAESEMNAPLDARVKYLGEQGAPPVVVGFGISRPNHVATAIRAGAGGAISGSATVRIVEKNLGDRKKMHRELAAFVQNMLAATKA